MKTTAWWWVLGLGALVPAGLRSAVWLSDRPVPVDDTMAQAGGELFRHEWTMNDPLAAGGDGLGPVFNANSCAACHYQNGVGGSGSVAENVTIFAFRSIKEKGKPREGVVHAGSTLPQVETLADVDARLPNLCRPPLKMLIPQPGKNGHRTIEVPVGIQIAQLNTPALFGSKLIDDIPDHVILANQRQQRLKWGLAPSDSDSAPVGRASTLANGRVGRFGWKGQTATLAAFVQAACANELGLGNPGQAQPAPLFSPGYQAPGLDLTVQQCDQLTAFVSALPRPVERLPESREAAGGAHAGKRVFHNIGCAECHTPDLGSVPGLYSDLLLHAMSPELEASPSSYRLSESEPDIVLSDGALPREWRTPPLWGVADSAPYMHDGRAGTLEEAIKLHGGQAHQSAQRFEVLSPGQQGELIAFLKTLRAP